MGNMKEETDEGSIWVFFNCLFGQSVKSTKLL